jgi:hypothetical protein
MNPLNDIMMRDSSDSNLNSNSNSRRKINKYEAEVPSKNNIEVKNSGKTYTIVNVDDVQVYLEEMTVNSSNLVPA